MSTAVWQAVATEADRLPRWTNHLAAQVCVYMLVQFLPRPATYATRGSTRRKPADRDGMGRTVARLTGVDKEAVRRWCRKVENMRGTDPAFDERLTTIERNLTL